MVEELGQDKQPDRQAPTGEAPTRKQDPSKKNKDSGKSFSGIFGLFGKSKPKEDKPSGSSKPAPEAKKTTVLKPVTFGTQKINLKVVNQVLIVALIGLIFLLFYISLREKPEVTSVIAAISKIKLPEVESKSVIPFGELDHYLGQIKKRDIFSAFEEKKKEPVKVAEPAKEPEPPPVPTVPIEQKAKSIKLIGISWGDNPKAMIRNTSTQSVQFVRVGEKIDDTDLEVMEILKNEVILGSEGQEMSLM